MQEEGLWERVKEGTRQRTTLMATSVLFSVSNAREKGAERSEKWGNSKKNTTHWHTVDDAVVKHGPEARIALTIQALHGLVSLMLTICRMYIIKFHAIRHLMASSNRVPLKIEPNPPLPMRSRMAQRDFTTLTENAASSFLFESVPECIVFKVCSATSSADLNVTGWTRGIWFADASAIPGQIWPCMWRKTLRCCFPVWKNNSSIGWVG